MEPRRGMQRSGMEGHGEAARLTCSMAVKLEASWNRWMLMRSKAEPVSFQRVRMKPFRDHLHCATTTWHSMGWDRTCEEGKGKSERRRSGKAM